MFQVFNKPYPFNDDLKHNTKIIFFTSTGIFLFLALFQPFNINLLSSRDKYFFLAGIAFSTFLTLSINLLLIPSLFPRKFSTDKWTIKKEILWNLWMLFSILGGYFLLNTTIDILDFSFGMVIKLLFTAVIPITVLIIVNHNKILRDHLILAEELTRKIKENKAINDKIIHFISDYQKDNLSIKVNSLVVIRSANNYIEVFWHDGELTRNQMVRCSMLGAEETVSTYKNIIKCHRSYMINIHHIDRIEGNSQGYKVYLDRINFPVPVSKSSLKKIQELI